MAQTVRRCSANVTWNLEKEPLNQFGSSVPFERHNGSTLPWEYVFLNIKTKSCNLFIVFLLKGIYFLNLKKISTTASPRLLNIIMPLKHICVELILRATMSISFITQKNKKKLTIVKFFLKLHLFKIIHSNTCFWPIAVVQYKGNINNVGSEMGQQRDNGKYGEPS